MNKFKFFIKHFFPGKYGGHIQNNFPEGKDQSLSSDEACRIACIDQLNYLLKIRCSVDKDPAEFLFADINTFEETRGTILVKISLDYLNSIEDELNRLHFIEIDVSREEAIKSTISQNQDIHHICPDLISKISNGLAPISLTAKN